MIPKMTFFIEISCKQHNILIVNRSDPVKGIINSKTMQCVFFKTLKCYFFKKMLKKKACRELTFKTKLLKQERGKTQKVGKTIKFKLKEKADMKLMLRNIHEIQRFVSAPLAEMAEKYRNEIEEKYFKECVDI